MAQKKKENAPIQSALAALLGLSKNAEFGADAIEDLSAKPDLTIRDGKNVYLVQIANASTLQTLSPLTLMHGLIGDDENVRYILAAKYVPSSVSDAAKKLGVEIVTLPSGIQVNNVVGKGGLTTEKAWRAVTRLLAAKATSIRKIAIEERLSYGWAHATVKRLVEAGIARQRGSVVEMADVEALLNAVAWERPFEDLSMGAIKTSYDSLSDAVEALSRSASEWKMQLAFCGLTAATTYSGYGAMHDAAYCYICDKERLEIMKSGLTGNGVTIRFYKPDRDVFARAKTRDGVLLVSEGQALLDVAGMGYVAKDVALDMARRYAEIAADSH